MNDYQLLCYTKLVEAQEQYIKFLGNYISSIATYLEVHNMGASSKIVRQGELYRGQIKTYKELADESLK